MVAKSLGLQSSILRSGSRFFKCLCELRCLCTISSQSAHAAKAHGADGDCAPWIKRAVFEAFEDSDERQTLALGADIETQQLLLLPGRPWLLASPPPGSRRRNTTAGAGNNFHHQNSARIHARLRLTVASSATTVSNGFGKRAARVVLLMFGHSGISSRH